MLQHGGMDEMDLDINMDFDLLDSDADRKQSQKRPRRRVVVDTKDSNGRPYSQAEIRRMKRCAAIYVAAAASQNIEEFFNVFILHRRHCILLMVEKRWVQALPDQKGLLASLQLLHCSLCFGYEGSDIFELFGSAGGLPTGSLPGGCA